MAERGGKGRSVFPAPYFFNLIARSRFRRSLDTFAELFLSGRESTRDSGSLLFLRDRVALSARFHFCHGAKRRSKSPPPLLEARIRYPVIIIRPREYLCFLLIRTLSLADIMAKLRNRDVEL